MEIKIQKEKAIKEAKIKDMSWTIIGTIIWFFVLNAIYNAYQLMSFNENFGWKISYLFYSLIFMIIWEGVSYYLFTIRIKSLKYSLDEKENRLIKSWKVVLKHKDTAKLQVINSADINQDIWDKFVDVFSVIICYGFSNEGYYYQFDYLSEEEAEKILKKIKPSSKGRVDLE